ncbi:MAG: sll0787 family AIR synthase-like protein [Gammaproteobacteria bacterium]|nr:MAG: sll0787 family AIR synthase-like protein [Gammaproteobacteria bacterium]
MSVSLMLEKVKQRSGIAQKADLAAVSKILCSVTTPYPNGDDCAVIERNGVFNLLAIEGFMNKFVARDPWFAGWCGIMVNLSDIAAMGGVADAIWCKNEDGMSSIMKGMLAASEAYGVPIVGGHTHLKGNQQQLAVSILGHANRVLSSFAATPGQNIVVAIDLRGEYRAPFLNWNAATSSPVDRLRGDLALLPHIAEQSLATAAKDISQAGLLGTIIMLLESSNVGANIQLEAIPKPQEVGWDDWLCTFPSFGFILTCDDESLSDLLSCFESRCIAAAKVGKINNSRQFWVRDGTSAHLFWDFDESALTGLGRAPIHHTKE